MLVRRLSLLIGLALASALTVAAGPAQAVVLDMKPGATPAASASCPSDDSLCVTFPSDEGSYYGVALVPGTRASLKTAGLPVVASTGPCQDPWLTSDLGGPLLPTDGLCWHSGGSVMHGNETFALTWDPLRRYWSTSRDYVEQFLRDVADGSGTLTSPYALSAQYADAGGRAANRSLYGGGCVDFGVTAGASCNFGDVTASGPGHDYTSPAPPPAPCVATGTNQFHVELSGAVDQVKNDTCVTDAQIQWELRQVIGQENLQGHTQSGYTPLIVVLTPPGVDVCLDSAGTLCSANSSAPASFCSYHGQVAVGASEWPYVVQPWTAGLSSPTGCDDPAAPTYPATPTPQQIATDAAARLVSPLSQGQLAAIVNPALNGWFAGDGSEMNDNGCVPLPDPIDAVSVGKSGQNPYALQREFNNAGVLEADPNALPCAGGVVLTPTFVVPSPVNHGDLVMFDGSVTPSTLMVPKEGYEWNFGDGTEAVGPSVEHVYARGGTYTVTLSVTDRGGNQATFSQAVQVLPLPTGGSGGGGATNPPPSHGTPLHVQLQLLPQAYRTMLRKGLAARITSNQAAAGFASLLIPGRAARRAHLHGRGAMVAIGRGTVSGITAGTMTLHLRLTRAVAAKLRHLRHLTVSLRLVLTSAERERLAIDAAGRY